MRRYESEQKARKEYGGCRLRYKLLPGDDIYWDLHKKNYEKMKDALADLGIWLMVEDDELSLSISPERYHRNKCRNAGRRPTVAWNQEEYAKKDYVAYRYADIIFMMQTLKDQEIADKIKMPIATYYRHKKSMKESDYFKSLDQNRLRDKEYLDNVSGNYCF